MSFTIKLQHSASPKKQLTKVVTDELTLTGTLREGSSAMDPVVVIEAGSFPVNCNYATISAFNRSYFITGIKSVINGMWEISLHCDVLSSFAPEIRANSAIIGKNENQYNLYLNDSRYRCYQDPHIICKKFPIGFDPADFSFVLALCADKEMVN